MCDLGKNTSDFSKTIIQNIKPNADDRYIEISDPVMEASNTESTTRRRSFTNMFAAKKTVAQGMMDIALITANANQLRYLLEFSQKTKTFYTIFILLLISLLLQVVVGVLLIFKGRYDLRKEKIKHAVLMSNFVVLGVFLITIINVFISAFTITDISRASLQISTSAG